jgi:hypothetical protein
MGGTHDGWDSKLLLLSVLEETLDVVTDDDTGLAVKLFKDTHCEDWRNVQVKMVRS